MNNTEINEIAVKILDREGKLVNIPCPDGIAGCAVLHQRALPAECNIFTSDSDLLAVVIALGEKHNGLFFCKAMEGLWYACNCWAGRRFMCFDQKGYETYREAVIAAVQSLEDEYEHHSR